MLNTCKLLQYVPFHENRTILKLEGQEVEETNVFSYLIINLKFQCINLRYGFYIKCKSEGKSGLLITKF